MRRSVLVVTILVLLSLSFCKNRDDSLKELDNDTLDDTLDEEVAEAVQSEMSDDFDMDSWIDHFFKSVEAISNNRIVPLYNRIRSDTMMSKI